MKEKIKYGEKIENTQLLGPGNRAVLWVYGCCFGCDGCIAYNFKNGTYREDTIDELANWFINTPSDGITISGGEPMLQAGALALMVKKIREHKDIGVIVYTGFLYEQLLKKASDDNGVKLFLSEIDLLIDGPFIKKLNDDKPYRGSSNQRFIPLTDRYLKSIKEYYSESQGRKVEIRIESDKTLMVGVPSKDQAEIWNNIKLLESSE